MTTIRVLVILAVAFLAAGCHTPQKKKQDQAPHIPDQNGDVTFQAFLGRLRAAAGARDMQTIASMMTPDFGYHINPDMQGDGVFQYWDQNNVWPELRAVLQQKFVPAGNFMVAPPAFVNDPQYHGYRAGIAMVNGSWKFAYFVRD